MNEVAMTLDIDVTLEEHIATIRIMRGPSNFIDAELVSAIADQLDDLAEGGRCRAVLLCSQGKHFCAGGNFTPDEPLTAASSKDLYDTGLRLFDQPLPLIAAIQGAAVGGGLGLALAADFRIASPEARFMANFARLGFHQGFGMSVTLPYYVGPRWAAELLYTGRRISAETALEVGLCDRIVPRGSLLDEAKGLAFEIAQSAPLAVRSIRETLRREMVNDVHQVFEHERAEKARLTATRDWQEGLKAMAERRVPDFTGK